MQPLVFELETMFILIKFFFWIGRVTIVMLFYSQSTTNKMQRFAIYLFL